MLWQPRACNSSIIAASLGTRREVVGLWGKRFFEEPFADLEERSRPGRPRSFPPELVVQIKALACGLPAPHALPLCRWSTTELTSLGRSIQPWNEPTPRAFHAGGYRRTRTSI